MREVEIRSLDSGTCRQYPRLIRGGNTIANIAHSASCLLCPDLGAAGRSIHLRISFGGCFGRLPWRVEWVTILFVFALRQESGRTMGAKGWIRGTVNCQSAIGLRLNAAQRRPGRLCLRELIVRRLIAT